MTGGNDERDCAIQKTNLPHPDSCRDLDWHHYRMVRLFHLRRSCRTRLSRDLLPKIRPVGGSTSFFLHLLGRLHWSTSRRHFIRAFRGQDWPQKHVDPDPAHHRHWHLPYWLFAPLRQHWHSCPRPACRAAV